MAGDDIRAKYKALLADLYPGEAIDAPSAITIGGDAPPLSVDFGVVKEDGAWRIPDPFRTLAGSLLLREAYRAGLPERTARAPAMVHACTWFAWKSIEDKAVQKQFFDTWLVASRAEKPNESVYSLPPAWIREIDKFLDIDPRELHGLLVRYSTENERLLGKQLRYDAAEQWAFHKAIELAPVPEPAVAELLYALAARIIGAKEPPTRQWLIDAVVAKPRFAVSYSTKQITNAFSSFANLAFFSPQPDMSLTGHRFVHAMFTPAVRMADFDWDALLHLPGMYLGLEKLQGSMLNGGEGGQAYHVRYCIPSGALGDFSEFFSALAANGIVASYQTYVIGEAAFTVNYNCYVPSPSSPSFVVGPVRDDPALFLRTVIGYSATPVRTAEFLARVVAEGYKEIRSFIGKAVSPFSLDAARYDSWLATMAAEARVSPNVARRWFKLVTEEYGYLVPEPRASYMFNSHVGALTRLHVLARGSVSSSNNLRIAALFPATFGASLRGMRIPDATFWAAFVPQGQLERAIGLVSQALPDARISVGLDNPLVRLGFKHVSWFDGTGFSKANDVLQQYAAAVPRVATGEWSLARFQQEVTRPAEDSYNAI